MSKILLLSRDPGGANQVAAVHHLCESQRGKPQRNDFGLGKLMEIYLANDEAVIVAKDFAVAILRNAGCEPLDWSDVTSCDDDIYQSCARLLDDIHPAQIITGTSNPDDETERKLWVAARERSIPSACIVDHFSNTLRRFRLRDGREVRPDQVFAVANNARQALLDAGFNPASVHLIPDPHLKALAFHRPVAEARAATLRSAWGAAEGDFVVLFPSEYASEMRRIGVSTLYHEVEELRSLLDDLNRGRTIDGVPNLNRDRVLVVVRPHPKDTPGKYDNAASQTPIRLVVSSDGTPLDSILASDVVIGMDSTMLFEAREIGHPAFSRVDGSTFNILSRQSG